jgi:hypothetical protein
MGRKSSGKEQRQPPVGPTLEKSGNGSFWLAARMALLVALIGAGIYVTWGRGHSAGGAAASDPAAAAVAAAERDANQMAEKAQMAKNVLFAQAMTALGPHKQASYPPVPYQEFAPPRPVQTVNAAFQFAAEHPEVLSYIPCFCGCEHGGHRGNEDCFVRSRAQNGDVTEWEPHGVECAVCIDVATRARQMYASGASVTQIRAAVEKEFKATYPSMTPTPLPPAPSH